MSIRTSLLSLLLAVPVLGLGACGAPEDAPAVAELDQPLRREPITEPTPSPKDTDGCSLSGIRAAQPGDRCERKCVGKSGPFYVARQLCPGATLEQERCFTVTPAGNQTCD